MLPGIRFLFAAIALSVSILIFGLGAAALLRAAHEQFSSNSSWRAAPERPMLAQQPDMTRPTLAMLRFDPPPGARESASDAPAAVTPAISPAAAAKPEPAAEALPDAQKVAALKAQDNSAATETPKADTAKVEAAPAANQGEAVTTPSVTAANPPASEPETRGSVSADAKPAASEAVQAAKGDTGSDAKSDPVTIASAKPDSIKPDSIKSDAAEPKITETEAVKPEPASSDQAPATDAAARKIAMLGEAPVTVEDASLTRDESQKAERSASKARVRAEARAERAKARRRLAAQRARLARQRAAQQQQPLGALFGQQTPAATN